MVTQDIRSFFRFYSTNSSFVHGGSDKGVGAEPAYGQQEIHARITQVTISSTAVVPGFKALGQSTALNPGSALNPRITLLSNLEAVSKLKVDLKKTQKNLKTLYNLPTKTRLYHNKDISF